MDNLIPIWNALKVALGLGFVIFIHELGHFLLAKWNGVKVEKFSIGFGPTLISFRRGVGLRIGTGSRPPGPGDPPSYGETEYIIAALPLGGYVKMLGESTEEQPADAEKITDPRAFSNKPVGGRMAIITAGVIMNLILGFVCFSYVHTQPGIDQEARIGGVLPGSPAAEAGLEPGDEIVAVDGQRDVAFTQVRSKISFSGEGQVLTLLIKRRGEDKEREIKIKPRREPGLKMPTIGFYPANSLKLASNPPFSPLPGPDSAQVQPPAGFRVDDKVVAVGPEGGPTEPVRDYFDLVAQLDKLRRDKVVVVVDRSTADKDGVKSGKSESVRVVVPPHHFVDFGFRLTPGAVVAVQPGSPARQAGFQPGDRIVAVADRADYNPTFLPDLVRSAAGTPLSFTIERPGDGVKPATTLTLTATPTPAAPWVDQMIPSSRVSPLEIPGLGLSMWVEAKVAAVTPDSPAAKRGLKTGDMIRAVDIMPAKSDRIDEKLVTFAANEAGIGWPAAFELVQQIPVKTVKFRVNDAAELVEIQPEVVADRYHPLRGLNFQPAVRPIPALALGDAVRLGALETLDKVTEIYKIFRNLAQRRVGADAFGGMIPIADIAYKSASAGLTPFVQFLGLLSVNLAVLNFLPIPPLDGGQFLFLAAEKIRGKPLPESYVAAGTIAGITFVLILIVVINVKDVLQLVLG